MSRKSLLLLVSSLLIACGPRAAPAPSGPAAATGAQGVRGTVSVLIGDFMPPGPSGGAPTPLAGAVVHVLAGPHRLLAAIDRGDPAYRGTVTTDDAGRFEIALAPGVYTVVTEVDGQPYLNCFQGDGTWCTVTVASGQWVEDDLVDNSRATY